MSDQNKENSPAVNEQEKQIASKALHEFRNSHYDECIQLLKKLSDLRSNDGRVTINKAVADFYQSNCCKTDELRKQLTTAKKQVCVIHRRAFIPVSFLLNAWAPILLSKESTMLSGV